MKTISRIALLCLIAILGQLAVTSCSSTKRAAEPVYATLPAKPVVLNVNNDGSIVVRTWGTGSTRSEAIDNALQSALATTLFDGFYEGQGLAGGQPVKPLVKTMNGRQKFSYYFQPFFSKGGEYLAYVTEDRDNNNSRVESKAQGRVGMSVVAIVDRGSLEQRLIQDGIIKP